VAGGIEDLFRAHWPLVLGYLARRTGSAILAEELAQETFYRATRAFLGWRGGSPAGWLLAIARNVLVDRSPRQHLHARARRRRLGRSHRHRRSRARSYLRSPYRVDCEPATGKWAIPAQQYDLMVTFLRDVMGLHVEFEGQRRPNCLSQAGIPIRCR
jgi:DNA-directed RNA polymerase specialized sigma24 family protein